MIKIVDGIKVITGKAFRLVWMGNQHITTIEGTAKSKTWTKQEVGEFMTEKQVGTRKKELDLTEIDIDTNQTIATHMNFEPHEVA